jgi:hypothetical protein
VQYEEKYVDHLIIRLFGSISIINFFITVSYLNVSKVAVDKECVAGAVVQNKPTTYNRVVI